MTKKKIEDIIDKVCKNPTFDQRTATNIKIELKEALLHAKVHNFTVKKVFI